MIHSKPGSRLKAQLTKSSLERSEGLPRPFHKFVQQMLNGFHAARSNHRHCLQYLILIRGPLTITAWNIIPRCQECQILPATTPPQMGDG